jgi:hypothetical protein
MRRIIITLAVALLAAVGLGGVAVATSSGSIVTRPRLERSVAATFSNVYSQQARLEGHKGITPASLHAKTMCDKGPGLEQSGPGTGWICLTSWADPNVPMPPSGYGKLEVAVHSNGCYTVGSPSTLIGYQTMTDARGRTVNNPAYEFDGCLDPNGDNTPTGATFPSELKITSTTANPGKSGDVSVGVSCGTGIRGCVGTVTASAGSKVIGRAPFDLTEEATRSLPIHGTVPTDAKEIDYTIHVTTGFASTSPTTVPVQR